VKLPPKWQFSPKNGHIQKFLWPEMWVVGRGGRKKIGPHQKHPKVFAKKFWGWGSHFGTLWPRKSQKMAILGRKSHISEISVAENGGGRKIFG